MKGQLWIVAAPSGGGKTSLINAVVQNVPDVTESISHTTRARRPGETDGVHYFFVSPAQFSAMVEDGHFLEYAQVFQHAYGTAEHTVEQYLQAGKDVILNIDWQGAQQVMRKRPDTRTVFLLPPSLQVLRDRLLQRGQDQEAVIEQRMAEACEQISHYQEFEYVIVNDDFSVAVKQLQSLILAARLERRRCAPDLQPLLAKLTG